MARSFSASDVASSMVNITPNTAINGQIFTAVGTLSGSSFLVNTYTNSGQTLLVVGLTNCNFVVGWQDQIGSRGAETFTYTDVSFRMFDPAGTALAPQQNMSVNAGLSQNAPSIAATAGGGFVAVWSCAHNASVFPEKLQDAVGVFGQRFNASGIGQGEFQVMPNLTRSMVNEINPSVTVLPDGKIVRL